MAHTRTIEILPVLAAALLTGCQILPPRDVFVLRLTLHHPNNPHALFMEGKGYLAQGETAKAAVRFRGALRLQPDFEEAKLGLAHAYRENGSYRRARDFYREILKDSPRNIQALEGLAVCESRLGRPDEAVRLFKETLAIDPKSVSTLNAFADHYYSQRQYGEALRYWEESLRLDGSQNQVRQVVEDLRGYVAKYCPPGK